MTTIREMLRQMKDLTLKQIQRTGSERNRKRAPTTTARHPRRYVQCEAYVLEFGGLNCAVWAVTHQGDCICIFVGHPAGAVDAPETATYKTTGRGHSVPTDADAYNKRGPKRWSAMLAASRASEDHVSKPRTHTHKKYIHTYACGLRAHVASEHSSGFTKHTCLHRAQQWLHRARFRAQSVAPQSTAVASEHTAVASKSTNCFKAQPVASQSALLWLQSASSGFTEPKRLQGTVSGFTEHCCGFRAQQSVAFTEPKRLQGTAVSGFHRVLLWLQRPAAHPHPHST